MNTNPTGKVRTGTRSWRYAGVRHLAAGAAAAAVTLAASASPALASNSTISIGVARITDKVFYGDGSYFNVGDYDNICLVIMNMKADTMFWTVRSNVEQECHTIMGSHWFTTITTRVAETGCWNYYARVSAYKDHKLVANKESDWIYWCPDPPAANHPNWGG
ncbi:hypothetical protein [Actinoplanes sp. NPDC020271]|uniref:hypothetical protein n=1 Tax=Actinoplanes sp. NPDC020271 TaxID=3363896 RepID=UPI0037BA6421